MNKMYTNTEKMKFLPHREEKIGFLERKKISIVHYAQKSLKIFVKIFSKRI